ncbi:VanZ family protein [Mycolicibacterium sp.]|uniref:VanZ family protein n=1 Tax=Mycolicibacterium sp. TaxID=2320850 RepID=UPI0028A79EBD|nr:VanZ family protein [Mycolicibacterium sp.]
MAIATPATLVATSPHSNDCPFATAGGPVAVAVWFGSRMPGRQQTVRQKRATALWLALFCWAGVVLYLSSLSPAELPEAAFAFGDKVNHFAAFAVGGWLAASALRASRPQIGGTRVVTEAILLVAAFGALDEALQTWTPGRVGGDVLDWTADALGATAGALLSRLRRADTG